MAKIKNTAFDDAFNSLGLNNPESGESISDVNDILDEPEIVEMQGEDKIEDPDKVQTTDSVDQPEPKKVVDNKNIDDADTVQNNDDVIDMDNVEIDSSDDNDDPNEAVQIGAFFDAFAEQLGWEVDDEEKPDSIESLVQYIEDVVDENSKPQYADERIARLDEYVKNGGKFEDMYSQMSRNISYDSLDMENEDDQKMAVRDYLKLSGYTDEQISKKIERYEDAGVLEDEANDAIDRLKIYTERQLQAEQEEQKKQAELAEENARQFVSNLNETIGNLKSIRGVNIPKEDRKLLFEYITKVDANGQTQYQKDFNKNMVNNLIESAYFTMKGDALINEATKNGQTTAANKLRKMLRHSSKNHSTYNIDDKQRSVTDIASMWYK